MKANKHSASITNAEGLNISVYGESKISSPKTLY